MNIKKILIALIIALSFLTACGESKQTGDEKIFNELDEAIDEQNEETTADSLEKKLEKLEKDTTKAKK